MAGYSNKSLGDKLGLKSGMKVFFEDLPEDVRKELKNHLTDVEISKTLKDSLDYLHVFVKESEKLRKRFPKLVEHLSEKGMIWISWPKGSSKVPTDINENIVRNIGLELGIVDVKVCAVSDIWSGLKFYRRKK
ncbi:MULTISPECIES: DUF3052 family protein [Leptospira]|uniref:PF11253 family protein n=4 Tax=Leptospira weilii TaxID=28184 RepID=A0A828YYV7_9LEPT|nr:MULTISPECIES: DUF3052 family protein [Leptospira]EMM72698.1 hypothetical protein LEP1GSC038_1968 [Leptospira weilii str. 2006001855]EMY14787.1 hypothetical protein LEP1GSC043_0517 [Leptospira weilii str. Ecochallenge]EKR63295.1 hypothetical protein LEP1GSC036_3807 [Leptospira weilii str. 2006001853]EMJ60273.1 hypothetical protein LEP1GSC051_0301 [Leptospira sp. P2653]EMN43822.1 hypothetical protein LEP1GSC086_4503 [Leptospira weilii str. LNT 1234]